LLDDSSEIVAVSNLRRTIMKNGGVLQDEIWSDVYSRVVQRFWIEGVSRASR
jgi:predicted acetyltransferase